MMIIDKIKNIFTKEDNVLEAITPLSSTYEFGEVVEAKKSLPKWWKEMPNKVDNYSPLPHHTEPNIFSNFLKPISTIKYCPAVQDIFSTGLVLKAWTDMSIYVSPDGIVTSDVADQSQQTLNSAFPGSNHPYVQRAGFLKNYAHYKLTSPFLFKTKTYRKFLFCGAFWSNPYLIENNVHIVPGIIDFKSQAGTNINMFLPIKKKNYELKISLGDPLVHIIPLDTKPVKVVKKLVTINEWLSITNVHVKFLGSPKTLKSRIKN